MIDRKSEPNPLAEQFIKAFHRMIHTIRIHQDNNELMQKSAVLFRNVLIEMAAEDDLELLIWRSRIYLKGEKLLYRRAMFYLINNILDYFSHRALQGLCFFSTAGEASHKSLITFARLMNDAALHEDPASWLSKKISENGFFWVKILEEIDEIPPYIEFQRKKQARQAYMHTLSTVKEVAMKVSRESVAGVRKARRLAQTMVDMLLEDESLLLGLTTIRDYDDYTYVHSVNVALLSMCLGRRIGLSQLFLEQLAICGMLHDLGKVEVPKEILVKPGGLNERELELMRKHPLVSVERILRLQAPRDLKLRIVTGPFGHHLNYNLSGYPKIIYTRRQNLFGQILRIADTYDALTSHRSYRPMAYSPDGALRMMWRKAGENFSPILMKVFINMMGLYPAGSVLQLDNGDICLVIECPHESDRTRPLALLLVDDGQGGLAAGEKIDLAKRDPRDNTFLRNVVKSIHPSSLGIQPFQFFMQEIV